MKWYMPDGKTLIPVSDGVPSSFARIAPDVPHYLVTLEGGTPWRARRISTVWLGLDHSHGYGPPLVWETMVFPEEDSWRELACKRYPSEEKAWEGHQRMVEMVRVEFEGHKWLRYQMIGMR